jgi:DNA-binding IclR family transcriptional regulator
MKTPVKPPLKAARKTEPAVAEMVADPAAEPSRYSAPALEKGLDIIEILVDQPQGLTPNELAKALGRTVGEIFRMVVVLQQRGYVQVDAADRYSVTLKLLELAHHQQPLKSLVATALPLMRELANRAKQSCHLCTYFDGRIIVAAQVDSPGLWSFGLKVGAVMGLTETASGHVLLAFRDEAERTRMLAAQIRSHGDLDIDPAQLLRRLEELRSQGYTIMPSRHTASVTNIAHPVFGVDGHVIASLTVPFIGRLDPGSPSISEVGVQAGDVARHLSDLMGYRGFS